MANALVDTGHNTTATLGTSTFVSNVTSVGGGQSTRVDVSTTYLSTATNHTFMPGDLSDAGEVTIDYQFDPPAVLLVTGVVETLTVTLPTATGFSTAATLAGTGYIKSVTRPTWVTDSLQMGQFVFKFNGLTGPTYTVASV